MSGYSLQTRVSWLVIGAISIITIIALYFVYGIAHHVSGDYLENYKESVTSSIKKELSAYTYLGDKVLKSFAENSTKDKLVLKSEKELKKETKELILQIEKEQAKTANKDELIEKIRKIIKEARFGDNNYFWVAKLDGTVLIHPITPNLEGQNLTNTKDINGKYFVKDLLDKLKTNNEAVIDYKWLKPDTKTIEDKVSYGTVYEPLNLIIITGRYIDDLKQEAKNEAFKVIKNIRLNEVGYFWIISREGNVLLHVNDKLIGQNVLNLTDATGKNIFKEIVEATNKQNSGYIEYKWKNDGDSKLVDKITHFRLFDDWNIIIATGADKEELRKNCETMEQSTSKDIRESLITVLIVMSFIACVITAIIVLLMSKTLMPVTQSIDAITVSSKEVFTTASAISDSANNLASSSANQSSSIEEISATIEEYTATIRSNAQSLFEANKLSNQSNKVAIDGFDEIKALIKSIDAINVSSSNIANIIKTIDEIAFQTNLLALNAAVEAARAGEHGLGFAVVAEEVRSLASRSAGAAKETTNIIEQSIQDVHTVNNIATNTNESFMKILQSSKELNTLIQEVTLTAKEQSEGLVQINASMNNIDHITQGVASSSEELASSATQLSAIASEMQENTTSANLAIKGHR